MIRSILNKLALLLLGLPVLCAACAPNALPPELVTVIDRAVDKVTAEGVLEKFTSNVSGQAIEPGIEAYGGILYVGGARLKGVSVQLGLTSEGSGVGEPRVPANPSNSRIPTLVDEVNKFKSVPASQPATQ